MKQIPGKKVSFGTVVDTVPAAAVGIDLATSFNDFAMRPTKWAIDLTVTVLDSDVELWVRIAETDVWCKYNDKRGRYLGGRLNSGAAIVAGSGPQIFVVEDLGVFDRIQVRKTVAGATVVANAMPILESTRPN